MFVVSRRAVSEPQENYRHASSNLECFYKTILKGFLLPNILSTFLCPRHIHWFSGSPSSFLQILQKSKSQQSRKRWNVENFLTNKLHFPNTMRKQKTIGAKWTHFSTHLSKHWLCTIRSSQSSFTPGTLYLLSKHIIKVTIRTYFNWHHCADK